jgi:phage regulator Rha-like protein
MKNLPIIQNKIHEIRGLKVMLDFDLAELYQLETKRLKEAVRRNSRRFPSDFMFELTREEYISLRTQFATLKKEGRGQHLKYLPYAFTEHGVTMLASVLNSERAIEMNIAIVRAFIALRQIALHHKDLAEKLDQLKTEMYERLGEHDAQLNAIYEAIENLLDGQAVKKSWEERNRIGYKK